MNLSFDASIERNIIILCLQWTRQLRVSNQINHACFFETKVWRNKNALHVQQIIPLNYMIKFRKSFNLKKKLYLEYLTACCKFDSCGSRNKCLFSVFRCHLNNVIIKQNSCYFNNKTFITLFCFKVKQKYVKELTKP